MGNGRGGKGGWYSGKWEEYFGRSTFVSGGVSRRYGVLRLRLGPRKVATIMGGKNSTRTRTHTRNKKLRVENQAYSAANTQRRGLLATDSACKAMS